MTSRLDPDLEKILPLLPLRNAASLTPERARAELVALAESRKDVAVFLESQPVEIIAARDYL